MSRKTQPPEKTPECLSLRIEIACVVSLLLLHLLVCLHTAVSETVTHDEIWHLPVGVRNLREGAFDVERLNPPLSRMWAAIPLVIAGVQVDQETDGTALGKEFVETHPQDFWTWYRWGRGFHLMWSLATGFIVYLWARELFGINAALVTLVLYVTCPNIAAHASLVTPDSSMMFGFTSVLFALSKWCDRPRWSMAILWGVLLGVAEAVKFTGLLLYPLVVIVAVIKLWKRNSPAPHKKRTLCSQFLLSLSLSLLVLWASYGFQGLFRPLDSYQFQSTDLATIQKLFEVMPGFAVPLPEDYLRGIDEQRHIMEQSHPVYLDGEWSLKGFRSYYFKSLLYKLPHPFQGCLLLATIFLCLRRYPRRYWRDLLTLLLPVGLLLIVATGEGMQLGVRYILPVFPLMMIFAGSSLTCLPELTNRWQRILGVTFVVVCGLSLRYQPHHLAYFNEYAGGPIGGREHLLDSNLDWGQDLHGVQEYFKEQGIDSIGLAYFGTVPPQSLGIDFELPPSWNPEPGLYAVSVNFVMGRPHSIIQGDGTSRSVDFQEFGYFRFFQPVKTLGGSIDIYDLSAADVEEFNRAM